MDRAEEDLKRMRMVGWRAKVKDGQEWNRIVEQTKTHSRVVESIEEEEGEKGEEGGGEGGGEGEGGEEKEEGGEGEEKGGGEGEEE